MPVYEYAPKDSGHAPGCTHTGRFEVSQRMSDKTLEACPACGVPVQKLISNTSFALKGSGWYASDYKSSKPAEAKPADATPAGTSPGASSETKSAAGACGASACATGCAGGASA